MLQEKDLNILEKEIDAYLSQKGFADSSIYKFHLACRSLRLFMEKSGFNNYSSIIYQKYLDSFIKEKCYEELPLWDQELIRWAGRVNEYYLTGIIQFYKRDNVDFSPSFKVQLQDFWESNANKGLSSKTLKDYRYHLKYFDEFLNKEKIRSFQEIDARMVIKYSKDAMLAESMEMQKNFSIIRRLLKFAYQQKWTETDLSGAVPVPKRPNQSKLPSVYSKEEVEELLNVIERKGPKGKRDYAMVLLAARLGLRASDICALTFENICWEKSLISLCQIKTGRKIELPLLKDIGEALIDYLKYGRPQTTLPYIFIQCAAPYGKLTPPAIHKVITEYLRRAGIPFENERKHGPHALRHSLVNTLLYNKVPIPVISGILGHASSESTKIYMRIDIESLRQCALEVPPVGNSFYERQGLS